MIPRDSLSEKMDAKTVLLSLWSNGRAVVPDRLKFMRHMNFNRG
jgi:hypothetical protein